MYKLLYLARRNPNVSREDWPETWRSHSKFAGQFPGLRSGMKWSRYCNRIDKPTVGGKAVDLPGVSVEHDGVAVCCSEVLELLQGGAFTTKQRALIQADELRVFDRLTPDFSYHCLETVVRDGVIGEAGVFRFLVRQPDIPKIVFRERFLGQHAQAVKGAIDKLGAVTRYTLNTPLHRPLPFFPFDAISECWYASVDDAVRSLHDGQFAAVERDLQEFCDVPKGVVMLTDICNKTGSQ